jgi:tetratricopeptide (TPR) repeat protein
MPTGAAWRNRHLKRPRASVLGAAPRLDRTFAILVLITLACVREPSRESSESREPLRVSEITQIGDPRRQASQRLVIEGLEADAAGESERALASYERAIQMDGMNPYAYLAIARYWIEVGEPERGVVFVDQAEVLIDSSGESTHGARVHLVGLRGRAGSLGPHSEEAANQLRQAADLAPQVWGDGILSADELR